MEEQTIETSEDLDPNRPRRKITNKRAYKQKAEKKPKKLVKYIQDPTSLKSQAIPTEPLKPTVHPTDLVARVNQLQKVVQIQSTVLADVREWFRSKRQETEVDEHAVALLAARGNNKSTIATLLGFDVDAFIGLAEVSDALSNKQLDTAFNGKGMPATTMQIFLGKVLLGQKDGTGGHTTNVAVVAGGSGGALREKIRIAREDALKGKQSWDSTVQVIDADYSADGVDVVTIAEPQS
jgi:hypothetical protein